MSQANLDCLQVCCSGDLAQDGKLCSASPAAILDALTLFRTQVRNCAKTHKLKPVLEECDRCPLDLPPPLPKPT